MKTKSLLFLALVLIVCTFALASCEMPDLPFEVPEVKLPDWVPDSIKDPVEDFFAKDTTTAPVTTAPVTTAGTTAPDPGVTDPIAPVDPLADVALADGEFTYDGTAKALAATGFPEGAAVEYAYAKDGVAVDAAIAAGTYTVTATVSYNGESVEKTATLTIAKKKVAVGATLADDSAEYNGQVIIYEAATGYDPDLFTVAYTYSAEMVNVGEYTVTATFALKDAANYEIDGDATVSATFTITKSTDIDLSGVKFEDTEVNYYTGEAFTYNVINLPVGVTVEYTYVLNGEPVDELKAVGTYTVTATFASENYVIPEGSDVVAEFVILNTIADLSGVVLEAQTLVYNGAAQAYVVENLPAGITAELSYTQSGLAANPCVVGTYDVLIKFSSEGYTIPEEWQVKTATLVITPKKVDLTGVEFLGDAFIYDGTVKAYNPATGYDSTVFNVTYAVEGDQINAGSFTVSATFALVDTANYEFDGNDTITATYTIAKQKVSIDATFADGSDVYNGQVKAYEQATGFDAELFTVTYTYSAEMLNAGEYTVTATFVLKDTANYELEGDDAITATFVIDPAPIKVEATFAGATYTYDGQEKPYNEAVFDAELFTVTYAVEGDRTNAGSFVVTATFAPKSANYTIEGEAVLSATYVIEKAAIEGFDAVVFENAANPYTGAVHSHEAANLPEGVSVTYKYMLANGEIVNEMINAGEYTVVATFKLDDNHVEPTLNATYTILAKEVSIADLGLAWNVEGANKFGDNYAYKTDGNTPCEMKLVDEAVLADNCLSVTYKTTMKAETAFETDKEVTGAPTAHGTYETVATFAVTDANYKLVGDTSMSTIWGIYDSIWSPLVK